MTPKSTDLETQAAELLRTVDFAASELNQTALDAAREQEEARQNARLAAAMIRRYSTRPTSQSRQQQQQQSSPTSLSKSTSASSSSPSPPRMTAQGKLLSLGLELERCQRDLAEEKEAHQVTQEALQTAKTQAKQYAAEVQDLLRQQETLREEMGRRNDELERELNTTKQRLEAAEQDANLALELATNNNAAREEMEVWYQHCLERNQVLEVAMEQQYQSLLQNHAHHDATLPVLRNDENTTPPETSNTTSIVLPKKSTNAMVASGRRLLDDFRGKNKSEQMTDSKAIAERSHERRRQLADRLKLMDTTSATTTTTTPSSSTALVVPTQASDTFARISKLLKESGRRLSLPGRWWKKSDKTTDNHEPVSSEDTENLTKHFCHAVEVSLDKDGRRLML